MDPASLIDRIDWPATGLLIVALLVLSAAVAALRRRAGRRSPPDGGTQDAAVQLRELRQSMQDDIDALRQEVEGLRRELAAMRTVRGVPPQYGEAINLAGRGATARDIADQCGISVAEAELVRALGRKTKD